MEIKSLFSNQRSAVRAKSGAKATAVQTLRDCHAFTSRAKRLDCGVFTAALQRAGSPFLPFSLSPLRVIWAMKLMLSFAILTAQAQDGGAVSGVVVNSFDGTALPGATVTVRGTTLAGQTDSTGRFELKNLPPGDQVLRISKSGFAAAVVTDVRVIAGQNTTVNGNLRPEFYEMEEYEVTAEEFTEQTEQIMIERQEASGMMDAIGSDMMAKLGTSQAAEVVTKVSGSTVVEGKYAVVRGLNDRYVPTLLNGALVPSADPYRKSASLDQFPAQIIKQVTITKTFTPDKPGTFTGGGVDVETISFPDDAFLKFSVGTAYNTRSTFNDRFLTYDGGGTDWLGLDDGARELPAELSPGIAVPGAATATPLGQRPGMPAYERAVAEADTHNAQVRALGTTQFAPHEDAAPLDHSLALSFGDTAQIKETPLGYLGAFNYKREFRFFEDGRQQRLVSGTRVKSDLEDDRSLTTINWAAMGNLSTRLWENHELGVLFLFSQTAQDTARRQSGFYDGRPEDTFFLEKIQWLERNLNTFQFKGSSVLPTLNRLQVDYLVAKTQTTQDEPDTRNFNYVYDGVNYETGGNFLPDPQNPSRYFANLEENILEGKVDLTLPFEQWSGLEAKLKGGLNGIYTERQFWERQFQYSGPWNTGNPNTYLTDSNLGYNPRTNAPPGSRIFWQWQRSIRPLDANYDGEQKVEAAYLMTDFPLWESLRLIGGARVERTDMNIHSESQIPSSQTGLRTNDTTLQQTDVLPAAGLVYSIKSNMLVRLNYSQTIARPSFREFAAYRSYDPNLDIELEGNPNLQISSIKNYDVRWEWYPQPSEILSVSVFYKELEQAIEQSFISLDGSILSWQNRESAEVMGVEFEARKSLGFVHDSMANFSLGGNFSWIVSQTELTEEEYGVKSQVIAHPERTRPLTEQSPYILNLDLSYDNRDIGSSASLVFNLVGPRLVVAALITEDVYEQPAGTLDFIYSQRLRKNLNLRFTAKNLLDPVTKLTYGEDGRDIFSTYHRGRTFGISLSYEF